MKSKAGIVASSVRLTPKPFFISILFFLSINDNENCSFNGSMFVVVGSRLAIFYMRAWATGASTGILLKFNMYGRIYGYLGRPVLTMTWCTQSMPNMPSADSFELTMISQRRFLGFRRKKHLSYLILM